ncbi:MAG: L-2-hydroxyglutarate oxidase [Candidatus Binatia bacterium]
MRDCDVIIVGGGIVGLATAWALAERTPHLRLVLVEKMPHLGMHQSGRNSGVLHSGIYYKPGSLKAQLCVTGRTEMVDFCRTHDIAHELCGKVIVATTPDEAARLPGLAERARANGVRTVPLDAPGLRALEPHATGVAALHVPETGIADYPAVCATLARLLAERGALVQCDATVTRIVEGPAEVVAETSQGPVRGRALVACAGLHSDRLARETCGDRGVRIVPFRGEFFHLADARRDLVRNLIYPVPDPRFPFLGVHLTRSVDGSRHAGPNAVLALAREAYTWRTVRPGETLALLAWPGFRRLAARFWREGLREMRRSLSKRAFTRSLQTLVPAVEARDLHVAPSGIRAQAVDVDGNLLDDFAFVESARCVHVINAPSPAATASLPIGRLVAERVAAHLG